MPGKWGRSAGKRTGSGALRRRCPEVLLFSLEFILINLVVDVLYAAINPAIRYK
jgi:uncharacterized membrane protein